MLAFLTLAESKLKSWIIKYGRLESMELLLQSYGVSIQAREIARDCLTVFNCKKSYLTVTFILLSAPPCLTMQTCFHT